MLKIAAMTIAVLATILVPAAHPADAGSVVLSRSKAVTRPLAAPAAVRPAIIENGNDVIVYPYPGINQAGPFSPGAFAFAPDGHAYINASYTAGDNSGYEAKGIVKFSPDGTYSFIPAAHVGYEAADIIYARGSIWSTTYNGIAAVDPNGAGTRYYYLGINFNKVYNATSSVALGGDGAIYGLAPVTNGGLPLGTSKLFRIAANGTIASFAVPVVPVTRLVLAGDRHLYFSYVDSASGAFGIARIEQNGSTTLFATKNAGSCASGQCGNNSLVWSSSGYLYFALYNAASTTTYFGRMTTSGVTTLLPLPAGFVEGGLPFFSADQGGNLWTITSVNNGARGLYQYNVYTGTINGPYAGPELIYGSGAPIVGPDDNVWFIPDGYAVGPLGLAAYVRQVQTLVPASVSVSVAQSKTFTILETNFKGPWTAQSLSPAIASVAPASSSNGVFTVTGVSRGSTQIQVRDRLGNVSYETVSSS